MKLTKSQKIIILKAKVIKLKAKLKEARMELGDRDSIKPIESTNTLFSSDNTYDAYKYRSVVGVPKEVEERFKEALNDTPTPEPITSTTLKTPNEWLKLMSEEERTQWKENRDKADGWKIDMYKEYTFEDMIMYSFHWLSTPQGYDYWENLYNRYNN
jgi:hypothetical protein